MFRSVLTLLLGGLIFFVAAGVSLPLLILLLPSRKWRVMACNAWGKVVGPAILRIAGWDVEVQGAEHLDAARPAIYASNHTSNIDIFLAIWLAPFGAVGVAKREVAFVPVFGQMYLLSGHLLIDRGRHARAVAAMDRLVAAVRRHRLSIWIWPEGTRSPDGRLKPLKRGLYHLGAQTGLPVVPIVVQGAHRLWPKKGWLLRRGRVRVRVLPPVSTEAWPEMEAEAGLSEVHRAMLRALPADQRPPDELR